MAPFATTLLVNLAVIAALMTLLWLVCTARRDVSLVDAFWGIGFVVVAWTSIALNAPTGWRAWVLCCLVSVWGLRLGLHLLRRNWGHGEDRRYVQMRARRGASFWWVSLLTVFWLQGAIMWCVSLPLQSTAALRPGAPFGGLDVCAILLWGVGFGFEAVGDWQLARFKANAANAGRVMDRGLWRYTRHPNYFGDCCVWWAHYLIAAAAGAGWTVCSPLVMTFLLMKISGVALLESNIADRRPEYASYQRRTNRFFPGLPRSAAKGHRDRLPS